MRRRWIDILRSLQSFGCYFEEPCASQRNWKSDDNDKNDRSDDPIRNIEDGKDLRDSLRQRPAANDVGNRDLVNIAPLQLGKEVVDLHLYLPSECASFSNRGSPRSGSKSGSSRSGAGVSLILVLPPVALTREIVW